MNLGSSFATTIFWGDEKGDELMVAAAQQASAASLYRSHPDPSCGSLHVYIRDRINSFIAFAIMPAGKPLIDEPIISLCKLTIKSS